MESIEFRPEKAQMKLWLIGWSVPFVIGLAVLLGLFLYIPAFEIPKLLWVLLLIAWLVLMGLILLWIPAFYRSLQYVIDSDCIKMAKGVFWKKNVTVPFTKITNVDLTQGPLQRLFDIGTIHVQTAGAGGTEGARAELVLLGVRDREGTKETIMERARGYKTSQAEKVEEQQTSKSSPDILGQILNELKGIREVLENKDS